MLTPEERLYGLSQIWSEAKYNFAFWNTRTYVDWDREYREAMERVIRPMGLVDYYLELMRFISLLNDGHTHVDFPPEISEELLALPVKIRWISGKHVVTNVAQGSSVPLFSEILAINGVNFDRYMTERVLPYCWNIKPTSTYEMLYTFCRLDGNADKNAYTFIPLLEKNREIELLTSNGLFRVCPAPRNMEWSLPVAMSPGEAFSDLFSSEGLIIRLTADGIAVITLPTFMDDSMPENFYGQLPLLRDCRGFIVDVRGNGGGHSQNADAFAQAFIDGPFQTGKVKHAIHMGAYKAWGEGRDPSDFDLNNPFDKKIYDICNNNLFEAEIERTFYENCPLTLRQPMVAVENASTGSSSENLLISLDTINRATIVGVPSYGTTGNPLFINLPGGGRARVCTRRYTYPNDKEFINIGIEPHVYADFSREDLIDGRDSVMDRALEVLRSRLNN